MSDTPTPTGGQVEAVQLGECNVRQREDLLAELARLREEREKFFWELGQIKMTIDGTGQIEGAGWSEAHKAVVGLAERHQVMIRTNAGHMDNVEQLTEISKNQHSELSTLRATNAGLVKALEGIANSSNTSWLADRARAALDAAKGGER